MRNDKIWQKYENTLLRERPTLSKWDTDTPSKRLEGVMGSYRDVYAYREVWLFVEV